MSVPSLISLRGIDVIVSYRQATEERRENLYTVLRHLGQTYADYRLWLMEADARPQFDWARLSDPKIRHVFVHHAGAFPKSLLYNLGVRLSGSPVICFHDADSIARPETLRFCVDALLDGSNSDALCPYWPVINVTGSLKQGFVENPDYGAHFSHLLNIEQLPQEARVLYASANGGIVLFRRQEYIRVGGYNPQLEGWGAEDDELLSRASRLGLRWHSMHVPLIHLHHDTPTRTGHVAQLEGTANMQASQQTQMMPQDELEKLALRLGAFFG